MTHYWNTFQFKIIIINSQYRTKLTSHNKINSTKFPFFKWQCIIKIIKKFKRENHAVRSRHNAGRSFCTSIQGAARSKSGDETDPRSFYSRRTWWFDPAVVDQMLSQTIDWTTTFSNSHTLEFIQNSQIGNTDEDFSAKLTKWSLFINCQYW